MSLIDGCQSVVVDEFNGAKSLIDLADITPGDAIQALNCKYIPGQVRTREGFGVISNPPASTVYSSFFFSHSYYGSASHYWATQRGSVSADIVLRDLTSGTDTNLLTAVPNISRTRWATAGEYLYANVIPSGNDYGSGYVWDGDISHTMDLCFQRPMLTTEMSVALTEPSIGVCDAGPHGVGVLFQTRAGYWTRPGPVNSGLVLQASTITSAGAKIVRATLTPATTWPSWIKAVQLIYTPTLNNFQYYTVPGTITTVTPGSATVLVIDINVSDLQIRSIGSQGAGTLADDYFSLLSMDSSNAAPFLLRFMVPWGDRMVWFGSYGGKDCFFPSDQQNYETITADQHIIQLPGGASIGAAFALGHLLYVVGLGGGLFAYSDNGGKPVTFQAPQKIDGTVSVLLPESVAVSSSGSFAAIAALQGLFIYQGGVFPTVPLSYYQGPDWDTIAAAAGSFFHVAEIKQSNLIIVSSGAFGNAQTYVWNISNGMTPERAKFSKWTSMAAYVSDFRPLQVYNPITLRWEMWIGTVRQKSIAAGDSLATLYADSVPGHAALAIDFQYESSPLPENAGGLIFNHVGVRVRAVSLQSTGQISVTAKSTDGQISVTPPQSPLAITSTPGKRFLITYDLQNEQVSYLFTNGNTLNNGIMVSEFAHFYDLFAEDR